MSKNKLEFSFDSLEDSHDEILEQSPEPQRHAIDAHNEIEAEKLRGQNDNVDKDGTIFDPELHAVNKDGEPSLTPTGKFRKRRGSSKVSTQSEQAKNIHDEAAARAAGQLAADMMIGSCVTLLGEEWVPIGSKGTQEPLQFDEHTNLRRAFGEYFVAKGINDFPPGIMLSIALSSYAGARLAGGKETKTRLAKAKIWVSDMFGKLRKKKNATQSNSGDNRVRQDDTSEKSSRPVVSEATRGSST